MFDNTKWKKWGEGDPNHTQNLVKVDLNTGGFVGYYVGNNDDWEPLYTGIEEYWMIEFYNQLYKDQQITFSFDQEKEAKEWLDKFIEQAKNYKAFV